jgi:hypothetical protein
MFIVQYGLMLGLVTQPHGALIIMPWILEFPHLYFLFFNDSAERRASVCTLKR